MTNPSHETYLTKSYKIGNFYCGRYMAPGVDSSVLEGTYLVCSYIVIVISYPKMSMAKLQCSIGGEILQFRLSGGSVTQSVSFDPKF